MFQINYQDIITTLVSHWLYYILLCVSLNKMQIFQITKAATSKYSTNCLNIKLLTIAKILAIHMFILSVDLFFNPNNQQLIINNQYQYSWAMRYAQRFKKDATPQWWDCYIHYQNLKTLLKVVKLTSIERIQFQKNIFNNQIGNKPYIPSNFNEKQLVVPEEATQNFMRLKQDNQKANVVFLDVLSKQQKLFVDFALHKMRQIQLRFTKAVSYFSIIKQDQKLKKTVLRPYLQSLFTQSTNLSQAYQSNVQSQRRILTRFQLQTYGYFPTPETIIPSQIDISRINRLTRDIEQFYVKINQGEIEQKQKNRKRIRQLTRDREVKGKDSLIIGLMIGVFIAACVFLAAMLIYLRNYVQTDPIFNTDFPVWRGITLFIIYMWVLGINLHHYEKFNINYRAILENDQVRYPTSTNFFKAAGVLSTILVIVFGLYTLDVADVIQLHSFNPQFLPLFVWIPFIIYLINPISIFYFKSRNHIFTMLFKSLISWVIPVTYPIVYVTDQFLSILTPIQDTAYTICYYSKFRNTSNQQILQQDATECTNPASIFIFVFAMVIFIYRIMQCIKCGLQASPYNIRDFFNALKYTVAMVSTILSFLLNYNREGVFPAWIVFGVLTSIYTYYWDIKYDWILLEKGSYRFPLRDKLVYDKRMYYILLVLNLALRCSWVLTISTNIVKNFLGSPQVFVLLFAFLELIRRGVWNMLSVEAEHVKNSYQLYALPKSFLDMDKHMQAMLIQRKDKLTNVSVQRLVENQMATTHWTPLAQEVNAQQFEIIKEKVKEKKLKIRQIKLALKQTHAENLELLNYLFD